MLQEGNRIDIDLDLGCSGYFDAGKPVAQDRLNSGIAANFQQQALPVAPPEQSHWCGRGAKHEDPISVWCSAAQVTRDGVGDQGGVGADDQGCEAPVRRPLAIASHLCFGRHEMLQIAIDQRLHDGMVGDEGLQHHVSGCFGAASATGDLVQELDGAFRRPQIGVSQTEVRIDDPDEGEMWEMPAFGDELRADDQIDFPRFNCTRGGCSGVGASYGIAGHDQASGVGEKSGRLFRNALDARTDSGQAVYCPAGDAF